MKPQNIIIAVIFLLVISLFSFNFENITGHQVRLTQPEVDIKNDQVKAGQPIQFKIKINEYCVNPKIDFYYKGLRKDTKTYKPTEDECAEQNFHTCKANKYCRGDLEEDTIIMDYYTLPSWKVNPGIYKARVYYIEKAGQNRFKEPYIEVPFKIIS